MARRSRAREVALQVLYQDDLNAQDELVPADEFLSARLRDPELIEFAASLAGELARTPVAV